jgi:hypothetical protein
MRYQLSWHSNQSLDASPANARKGAAKAKWEDRFNLSWHTNQDLDFPRSVERKEAAYPQWQDKLNNFLHVTQTRLIGNGEPQVWQSVNAAGQTTWNAYDSGSEKAIYDVSEAELRSWLENLHYQN